MLNKIQIRDFFDSVRVILAREPKIFCSIEASDYDCRPARPPTKEFPWNSFIHLKVKIANRGNKSSKLIEARLEIPGEPEFLEPRVYKNDGGAHAYIKGDLNDIRSPPESEQSIPINFILPSAEEMKLPLKAVLHLTFEKCRRKSFPLTIKKNMIKY